jgi:hypothetical protein
MVGKIIICLLLVGVVVFLLVVLFKTEHNTVSTYNYQVHDTINEREQFLLVLGDEIFNHQAVWVNCKHLAILNEHPPLEVTYTLFKFQKKASVSNISCSLIKENTIVEKWN